MSGQVRNRKTNMRRLGFVAMVTAATKIYGKGTRSYNEMMSEYFTVGGSPRRGKGRNRSGSRFTKATVGKRQKSQKVRSNRRKARS